MREVIVSKRAWYNCNERKARALVEQGYQVRIDSGRLSKAGKGQNHEQTQA